jgi:hypothetical protein
MVNLEMQWWHTNDAAAPPTWQRMQVYPNPMLGSQNPRAWSTRKAMSSSTSSRMTLAYGPYTVQLKALAKEVHAGRARYDGGYFAGFDHCDASEVDACTTYGKGFRHRLPFPQSYWKRQSPRTTGRADRHRHQDHALDRAGLYVAGGAPVTATA